MMRSMTAVILGLPAAPPPEASAELRVSLCVAGGVLVGAPG